MALVEGDNRLRARAQGGHLHPELAVGEVPPPGMSEADLEEMARIHAPSVNAGACTGCGLCEYRCHSALVRQRKLIPTTAIVIKPVRSIL